MHKSFNSQVFHEQVEKVITLQIPQFGLTTFSDSISYESVNIETIV
jgi:hypothetical protein